MWILLKQFIESGGQIETIEFPSNVSELDPILIDLKAKGEQFLYLPLRASEVVKFEKACQFFCPQWIVVVTAVIQIVLIVTFIPQITLWE